MDNYGATKEPDQKLFRPSVPDVIEAPAKHINIVSQPIPMPDFSEDPAEDKPTEDQSEEGADTSEPEQN